MPNFIVLPQPVRNLFSNKQSERRTDVTSSTQNLTRDLTQISRHVTHGMTSSIYIQSKISKIKFKNPKNGIIFKVAHKFLIYLMSLKSHLRIFRNTWLFPKQCYLKIYALEFAHF